MRMSVMARLLVASALAAMFAICGCGDKSRSGDDDKSEESGESLTEANNASMNGRKLTQGEANNASMNGQKLILGIVQANIERQGRLGLVWPRTDVKDEMSDDIASMSFSDSTSYFSALFDMKNYGTSEWCPYVDGDLISTLGKNAVDGKTIRAGGVDWIIAADVKDETQDFMPVLISANFNPALLLNKWDGVTDASKRLPIGPESGALKSMFNDKAIVIVRKSGASEVIKAKYLTYQNLYHGQSFDITESPLKLKYLTPIGVVTPAH